MCLCVVLKLSPCDGPTLLSCGKEKNKLRIARALTSGNGF